MICPIYLIFTIYSKEIQNFWENDKESFTSILHDNLILWVAKLKLATNMKFIMMFFLES